MKTRLWPLLAFLPACAGNPIDDGRAYFNVGRYAEAEEHLDKLSDAAYRDLDVPSKAEYCLYRGLVFGALGDHKNAVAWLGLAEETEARYPGALDKDDRVRLKAAERKYGPLPATSEPPRLPGE